MSYPPGPHEPEQPGYGAPYSGEKPALPQILPTNGKATAALITGITTLLLSWCCGLGVLGVIAIVLGVQGRAEIRRSPGIQTGDGLALAGIITGSIAIVVGLLVLVLIAVVIASGQAPFTTSNA